jgi:hypothetical protein
MVWLTGRSVGVSRRADECGKARQDFMKLCAANANSYADANTYW